jgi:hypothetical protein
MDMPYAFRPPPGSIADVKLLVVPADVVVTTTVVVDVRPNEHASAVYHGNMLPSV